MTRKICKRFTAPYLTRSQAKALVTEEEWLKNAHRIMPMDYDILHDWSEKATNPQTKETLYKCAVRAYNIDNSD